MLSGAHKSIDKKEALTNNARLMSNVVIVQDTDVVKEEEVDVVSVHLTQQFKVQDFFFAEELGVLPTMSCSSCLKVTQNCTDCDFH